MSADIIPYHAPEHAPVVPMWRGVVPTNMDDSLRMAKVIVASGMAPRSLFSDDKVDPVAAVWTVLQLGAEVGLSPMSAVQNVCLINGRPGLFGPAMLAVVQASGKLLDIDEGVEGKDDARHAYCIVTRIGRKPRTFTFSVADAKRAGLWDKRGRNGAPGPWQQYPDRMLQARARTFALRDVFPDVLMGLSASVEELQDIPADEPEPKPEPKPEPPAAQAVKEALKAVVAPAIPPKKDDWPLYVNLPDGGREEFPRTKRGLRAALDFMETQVAPLVMNNLELLDMAAEKFPDMAERIAELRAAAAQALTPPADGGLYIPDAPPEDWTEERISTAYDVETGEVVEPDRIAQKVAERRGAAPSGDDDPVPF